MVKPLQSGEWRAVGFATGAEEPRAVHPQFFDSATADLIRSTVTSHGVTYTAIRVFEAAEPPADPLTSPPGARSKGGRVEKHDWCLFDREVVRVGWAEGFTTRRDLTKRMRSWVSENWPEPPDESTIRKRVIALCPEDIPAE